MPMSPERKREYMKQYRKDHPEKLKEWREKNKLKWDAYCKVYRTENAEYFKEMKRTGKYVAYAKEYSERKYKENPEKHLARVAVHQAKKSGKLIPKPCEVCGYNLKVEAHHEDYSKRLDVIWLCKIHHIERHKKEVGDTPQAN